MALEVHSIPGMVELSREALSGLVAKALGVARHGDTVYTSDPGGGGGHGSETGLEC